jgi:membrane protein
MVVVGPLLGGGRVIASWLGFGEPFEWIWAVARWPVVFAAATGFLSLLYHFGPNARSRWRESLPGALFGMLILVLVAIAFRLYIGVTGLRSPAISDADDAVVLVTQAFGALMAVLLWIWLSAMVLLTGGVLNAEVRRLADVRPVER